MLHYVAVGRELMVCCRLFRICSVLVHRQMGLILCTLLPSRPTSECAGQQSITNRKSVENTFHLFSTYFRRLNNLYPILHYWFNFVLVFPILVIHTAAELKTPALQISVIYHTQLPFARRYSVHRKAAGWIKGYSSAFCLKLKSQENSYARNLLLGCPNQH